MPAAPSSRKCPPAMSLNANAAAAASSSPHPNPNNKTNLIDKYLSNFTIGATKTLPPPRPRFKSPPQTTNEKSISFVCSDSATPMSTAVSLNEARPPQRNTLTIATNGNNHNEEEEPFINVKCTPRSEHDDNQNCTVQILCLAEPLPETAAAAGFTAATETDIIIPPAEQPPIELPQISSPKPLDSSFGQNQMNDSSNSNRLVNSSGFRAIGKGITTTAAAATGANHCGVARQLASAVGKSTQSVTAITDHILVDIVAKCLMAVFNKQLQPPTTTAASPATAAPTTPDEGRLLPVVQDRPNEGIDEDSFKMLHSMTAQQLSDKCDVLKAAVQRVFPEFRSFSEE